MYKYSLAVHTAKSECSKVPKSKVGIPVKVKNFLGPEMFCFSWGLLPPSS
jgi:hypothetical protein